MALTSEEVTEYGGKVIDHINRLADQMIVFQNRLDGLTGQFADLSSSMDSREDEIRASFKVMSENMSGQWSDQAQTLGSQITSALTAAAVENIDGVSAGLDAAYESVEQTSGETIGRWTTWQDTDIPGMMEGHNQQSTTQSEALEGLNGNVIEDSNLISESSATFVEGASERMEELNGFLDEATGAVMEAQEAYSQALLESFSSQVEELVATAKETLGDVQDANTKKVLNDTVEQFQEMLKSELIPLIDQMVEEVSEAIDKMLESVASIGKDQGEQSAALDEVTSMLKQIIEPIQDTIKRTQGIQDTVSAFM